MGVTKTQVVKFIRKGDKGDTGAKGEQGATLRGPQAWSDCATGYAFQAGGVGEQWKDVVLYNGNYYSCVKSHTKTASNYPGSTTATNSGLWQLGDKIDLVATNLLLATYALIKNLGVEAVEMKDSSGNVLFQVKDGNVTCKTGTFENVVVSGVLNGVTGSFKSLNCVNGDGTILGGISFGSDGKMWFSGDMYHQGYNSALSRSYRFYTSDVWCRGQFGSAERNVLVVHGSYGYYYTKGISSTGTYVSFSSATDSSGNTYYKLPLYGTSGDYAGFPVDIVVFKITSSTTYKYLLSMSNSQRALLINSNDDQNNVQFYVNGVLSTLNGGAMREVCYMYLMQYPQLERTVLGAGLFLGTLSNNDW